MTSLVAGEKYQTFVINGVGGMEMPPHHSTKEAIVIIQRGMAKLFMRSKVHTLSEGDVFIIPKGVEHHLEIHSENFKAIAVMAKDSEIIFSQSANN